MSEWVSVGDRLPPSSAIVLVTDKRGIFTAYRNGNSWFCFCECSEGSLLFNITHWMPLPEPPPSNDEEKAKEVQKTLDAMLVFSSSKYELFESDKSVNSFPSKEQS